MKKAKGKTTKSINFQVSDEPGKDVFVAGTFNNWASSQHQMRDDSGTGAFKITLELPPGRHEYKFIVNGEWRSDTNCPEWVVNDHGSLNSVITV